MTERTAVTRPLGAHMCTEEVARTGLGAHVGRTVAVGISTLERLTMAQLVFA